MYFHLYNNKQRSKTTRNKDYDIDIENGFGECVREFGDCYHSPKDHIDVLSILELVVIPLSTTTNRDQKPQWKIKYWQIVCLWLVSKGQQEQLVSTKANNHMWSKGHRKKTELDLKKVPKLTTKATKEV